MIYEYPKYKNPKNNALGVLGGMLIGTLVGTAMMLLLAPRSGKETRTQIQNKGFEPGGRTTEMVEETLAHLHSNSPQIRVGAQP